MSVSLGGITLSDDMVIDNYFSYEPFSGYITRTLGGRVCYYATEGTVGKPINLIATKESGWITYATYKQLKGLINVNNPITLAYGSSNYTVIFRFNDPPVLDFTPLLNRSNLEDDDYMYGIIKLLEV